jgi:predicted transposase/invertase (TIGR01784 family)
MDEENQKSSNSAKSTNETKQHRSPKLKTTSAMGRRFVSLDWAMKKILRDKANFCVLEGFLSELLGEEVTIEEILESESNRQHARDKQNRVDIKVRRGEDQIILVELQFQRDLDFFHRILFGVSKAVTEHLESGSRYREVNKVISVNIVYFDPGVGDDYIYRGTTTFHGVHTNSKLELAETFQDYLRVQRVFQIFPEYYLLCVPRFQGRPKDTLDQWLYFLKTEEIEQDFSARGIQQAKQILHVANLSTPQRRAYEEFEDQARCLAGEAAQHKWEVERAQEKGLKEGREQGREEGREEGREQGRAEERRELARVMLESGLSREEVLRITGVDLE